MPNSDQFKATTKSVNALRRELLPRKFDPTGDYTDRVRTRAAGFRLLVHAEIEFYLEQISISAAQRAVPGVVPAGNPRGEASLEEITAVPGVDALYLSHGANPLEVPDPARDRLIDRAIEVCRDRDVDLGIGSATPQEVLHWRGRGLTFSVTAATTRCSAAPPRRAAAPSARAAPNYPVAAMTAPAPGR